MTPEERNLVTELFDRLATLEDAQRDPEAELLIQDGLRQAPNGPYALVQTVLIQDEALKRADARIRQLEAERGNNAEPPRQGGFLDSMRDSLWGRTPRAGSVPTVRPGSGPTNNQTAYSPAAQPSSTTPPPNVPPASQSPFGGGGGSFLSTAAAAAVGVVGSTLLMNALRSSTSPAQSAVNPPSNANPWSSGGGGDTAGSIGSGGSGGGDLSNQAGLNDIGRYTSRDDFSTSRSHGLTGGDTARAADEGHDTRNASDGRYTADNSQDHRAGGDDARYTADGNEEDIGDVDEGDFGGDFDTDQ